MTPPARFIIQKDGSMNILVSDEGDYECTDDNGVDVILSKEQVSELTAMLIDTRRQQQPDALDQLFRDCWGLLDTVKQNNTEEWMDYYETKKCEFEERYAIIRKQQEREQR